MERAEAVDLDLKIRGAVQREAELVAVNRVLHAATQRADEGRGDRAGDFHLDFDRAGKRDAREIGNAGGVSENGLAVGAHAEQRRFRAAARVGVDFE